MDECAINASKKQESSTTAPHSVIAEMWNIYTRATGKFRQPEKAKTFEDLDREIQQQFRDAMKEFDRMDQTRRG